MLYVSGGAPSVTFAVESINIKYPRILRISGEDTVRVSDSLRMQSPKESPEAEWLIVIEDKKDTFASGPFGTI